MGDTKKLAWDERFRKLCSIKVAVGDFEDQIDQYLVNVLINISRYHTSPNHLASALEEAFLECTNSTAQGGVTWQFCYLVIIMYLLNIDLPDNMLEMRQYIESKDSTLMQKIRDHLSRSKKLNFQEVLAVKNDCMYFTNKHYVVSEMKFIYETARANEMSQKTFEEEFELKTYGTMVSEFIYLVSYDLIDQICCIFTLSVLFLNESMLAWGYRHLFSMREYLDYEFGELYLAKAEKIEQEEALKAKDNPMRNKTDYMLCRTMVYFVLVVFMCNLHISPKSFKLNTHNASLAQTFVVDPMNRVSFYMNSVRMADAFASDEPPVVQKQKAEETQAEPKSKKAKAEPQPEAEEEEYSIMDLIYKTEGKNMIFSEYQNSSVSCDPNTHLYKERSENSVDSEKKKVEVTVCNDETLKCKRTWVDDNDNSFSTNSTTEDHSYKNKFIKSKWSSMYMDRTIGLHGFIATASKLISGNIRICVKDECKTYISKA